MTQNRPGPSSSAADLCQRQISNPGQASWRKAFWRWPARPSGNWPEALARTLAVDPPFASHVFAGERGARAQGERSQGHTLQAMQLKSRIFRESLDSTRTCNWTHSWTQKRRLSRACCRYATPASLVAMARLDDRALETSGWDRRGRDGPLREAALIRIACLVCDSS